MEKKQILSELNRTREIMGLDLDLIKEEEIELDDAGNPVEVETTATLDLGEEEQEVDDAGNPVEIETTAVLDLSEQEEEEEEEEIEVDPNAIVTKKKVYRVILTDGWELAPYISYKFNKQTQKPVPGSASMAVRMIANNTYQNDFDKLGTWKGSDPNNIDIYKTNEKLYNAFKKTAKQGTDKLKQSLTKSIVDWAKRTASESGIDGDWASMWGPKWQEQDLTRWIYKATSNKDSRVSIPTERPKKNYVSFQMHYVGRDEGVNPKADGWLLFGPGGRQINVTKWGKLYNTEYFANMVRGVQKRDEWYEFCQIIPDELKKKAQWQKEINSILRYNDIYEWKCKS